MRPRRLRILQPESCHRDARRILSGFKGMRDPHVFRLAATLVAATALVAVLSAQPEGRAVFDAFTKWKNAPANAQLKWGDALRVYREKLRADGLTDATAERTMRIIVAYDEGELYNKIYGAPPEFNTKPNRWLVEAVEGLRPGRALDVGMGQGRNALYLASRGWEVTGFDVAEVGVEKAKQAAAAQGLTIAAVHAADEEFDFGRERWDLIAIIYALEKRSVHRVREALKRGGLVVIEAGIDDKPDAFFGFRTNELREIFKGFRILKYEETTGSYDWGPETIQLVRLVAEKPR
jgi:hypothetical protein